MRCLLDRTISNGCHSIKILQLMILTILETNASPMTFSSNASHWECFLFQFESSEGQSKAATLMGHWARGWQSGNDSTKFRNVRGWGKDELAKLVDDGQYKSRSCQDIEDGWLITHSRMAKHTCMSVNYLLWSNNSTKLTPVNYLTSRYYPDSIHDVFFHHCWIVCLEVCL